MKILKSILNYIPLATFIIFVVTDGIISLTSALILIKRICYGLFVLVRVLFQMKVIVDYKNIK